MWHYYFFYLFEVVSCLLSRRAKPFLPNLRYCKYRSYRDPPSKTVILVDTPNGEGKLSVSLQSSVK